MRAGPLCSDGSWAELKGLGRFHLNAWHPGFPLWLLHMVCHSEDHAFLYCVVVAFLRVREFHLCMSSC